MLTNRMRNMHTYIESEYGKENVQTFRLWEKLEYKITDFENHQRFSFRCLTKDIIPVSVRLKSNIKTPKGKHIVRKTERALLNERVRSINNSITMFKMQWDTCINTLENALDRGTMHDCYDFIKMRRERRHFKTLERQLSKFYRLCQKNTGCPSSQHGEHGGHGHIWSKTKRDHNQNTSGNYNISEVEASIEEEKDGRENVGKNWVRNISKTPLTKAQENLLAHGPNYVIVPKEPPTVEYIAAIEKVCLKLPTGKVEELRGEIKAILKKKTNIKPNISKEESWATKELRNDNTRMVLTADKGVSMVVMDREDYNNKSEELLQSSTYKVLTTDPTTKHMNKLISLLKTSRQKVG